MSITQIQEEVISEFYQEKIDISHLHEKWVITKQLCFQFIVFMKEKNISFSYKGEDLKALDDILYLIDFYNIFNFE